MPRCPLPNVPSFSFSSILAPFHPPSHRHHQLSRPMLLPVLFLPLFVPFLSALLCPRSPFVSAQLELSGIVFPTPSTNGTNSTGSPNLNSTSGATKLGELVPKMVVESKKNGTSLPSRRRRRSTTTTDWGSEKMLTPQQLEAKFQQIRLLQQRPLTPLQPDLPPLQPPDFPPLSVPAAPEDPQMPAASAYDGDAAAKVRPQVTSGLGQFIHVKPTVIGGAFGLLTDAELEDPTLRHPFEEPFYRKFL